MTNQAELQPTINGSGEESALRAHTEAGLSWGHAGPLLDKMVIGYTEALDVYRQQFIIGHSDNELQRIHLETYLKTGKELIVDQTVSAINSNSLPEVGAIFNKYSRETIRAIAEVYVNQRFNTIAEKQAEEAAQAKLQEAASSVALSQTIVLDEQPSHVSYVDEDPNPDNTHKFKQVMSELILEPAIIAIDKTLGALGLREFVISGSNPIIHDKHVRADKKALHDNLSGENLTVTADVINR